MKDEVKSFRFYARFPSSNGSKSRRKSFGIFKRLTHEDGTESHETFECDELKSTNDQFQKSVIDFEAAKKNIQNLVKRLNREAGVLRGIDVFNNDNEKIVGDYWNKEYEHRDLVDPRGAYTSISRAARHLGNISLLTASRNELQKQINQSVSGNTQRTTVERINSLLKHIGRDIKLVKSKPIHRSVKFLSVDEFELVLSFIDHEGLKLLAQVAYFTGMREGECLAGSENNFQLDESAPQVYVQTQARTPRKKMDGTISKNAMSAPKSKMRWACIFPEGMPAIKAWLKIYKTFDLTPTNASKLLKEVTKKAFPNDPKKWMAFNGLRHSYAKNLFEIGANMGYVAKCLGNTEKVCQEYYSGWEHTPNSMQLLHMLIQKNKGKLRI